MYVVVQYGTFVIFVVLVKGDVTQVQDGRRQLHEICLLLCCHADAVHGCHHHLEASDIIQRRIVP